MNHTKIIFLTVDDVMSLHDDSIAHEGGMAGLRDHGLLESAVMMPQAAFDGQYLHRGIAAMAATYLFHVCQAHAFHDGNKRAALISAAAFLKVNGHELTATNEELITLCLGVAGGMLNNSDTTIWMRKFSRRVGK
jgi:death-on-curing protein